VAGDDDSDMMDDAVWLMIPILTTVSRYRGVALCCVTSVCRIIAVDEFNYKQHLAATRPQTSRTHTPIPKPIWVTYLLSSWLGD